MNSTILPFQYIFILIKTFFPTKIPNRVFEKIQQHLYGKKVLLTNQYLAAKEKHSSAKSTY